jgi:hypothetical protein
VGRDGNDSEIDVASTWGKSHAALWTRENAAHDPGRISTSVLVFCFHSEGGGELFIPVGSADEGGASMQIAHFAINE